MEDTDILLLDDNEDQDDSKQNCAALNLPWQILVVDDEPDVYLTTRLVFKNCRFKDHDIEVMYADSATRAKVFLENHPDIAVALIDVVMETNDAGLRLVQFIRDVMHRSAMRIILRTGQPGYAPERDVIYHYDINDYRLKTDLTAQSLFTSVITALRGYIEISSRIKAEGELERVNYSLEQTVNERTKHLFEVNKFNEAILLNSPLPMGVYTASGQCILANQAYAELIGITRESLLAQNFNNTDCWQRSGLKNDCLSALKHQRSLKREVNIITSYSNDIWIEYRILPVQLNGNDHLLIQFVDQTDRKRELNLAHHIQASILPKTFPKMVGTSGYGMMVPAREVGGDFFDFISIDEHRIGIAIGDVSGKGVPAAFFMAIARTQLRTTAMFNLSPGACLVRLNDLLASENEQGMFVTVFYGILDTEAGDFTYANGGHNPPALVKATGEVRWLPKTEGMLIGMMDGNEYAEQRISLDPGDLLFFYTDGVVESVNREGLEFTYQRLKDVLHRCGRLSVRETTEEVLAAVTAFEQGMAHADDIACISVRYDGSNTSRIGWDVR